MLCSPQCPFCHWLSCCCQGVPCRQCQRLRSGVAGTEGVSNSPAVNGSELRTALTFRTGSFPQAQGSCTKPKSFCQLCRVCSRWHRLFLGAHNLCALLLRHFPPSLPSSPPHCRNAFSRARTRWVLLTHLFIFSLRRYLNKTSDEELSTEKPLPEGATADAVTLRRRTLAAAAERRLQMQQNS